jgi:hypothetical protein
MRILWTLPCDIQVAFLRSMHRWFRTTMTCHRNNVRTWRPQTYTIICLLCEKGCEINWTRLFMKWTNSYFMMWTNLALQKEIFWISYFFIFIFFIKSTNLLWHLINQTKCNKLQDLPTLKKIFTFNFISFSLCTCLESMFWCLFIFWQDRHISCNFITYYTIQTTQWL